MKSSQWRLSLESFFIEYKRLFQLISTVGAFHEHFPLSRLRDFFIKFPRGNFQNRYFLLQIVQLFFIDNFQRRISIQNSDSGSFSASVGCCERFILSFWKLKVWNRLYRWHFSIRQDFGTLNWTLWWSYHKWQCYKTREIAKIYLTVIVAFGPSLFANDWTRFRQCLASNHLRI